MNMLPCRIGCEAYHDGCHKDCASWKDYLERQIAEREAKKRYITYHRPLRRNNPAIPRPANQTPRLVTWAQGEKPADCRYSDLAV